MERLHDLAAPVKRKPVQSMQIKFYEKQAKAMSVNPKNETRFFKQLFNVRLT